MKWYGKRDLSRYPYTKKKEIDIINNYKAGIIPFTHTHTHICLELNINAKDPRYGFVLQRRTTLRNL